MTTIRRLEARRADAADYGSLTQRRTIVRARFHGEKLLSEHALARHEPLRIVVDRLLITLFDLGDGANQGLGLLGLLIDRPATKFEFAHPSDLHTRNANWRTCL